MLFHGTVSFFSNLSLLIANFDNVDAKFRAIHRSKRGNAGYVGARDQGPFGSPFLDKSPRFNRRGLLHNGGSPAVASSIPDSFVRSSHDEAEDDGKGLNDEVPPPKMANLGMQSKDQGEEKKPLDRDAVLPVLCDVDRAVKEDDAHDSMDPTPSSSSSPKTCAPGLECVPFPRQSKRGVCLDQNKVVDPGTLLSDPHNEDRSLQVLDYTEYSQSFFGNYCRPLGYRYGYCSGCPNDPASFDPATTVLTLQCQGPCREAFGFEFLGTTSLAIGDFKVIGSGGSNTCSNVQQSFVDLCHPLGSTEMTARVFGSDFSCDCTDRYANVDIEDATAICSAVECYAAIHEFTGGVEAIQNQATCSVVDELCADPDCDCSEGPATSDGSGTVVCVRYDCQNVRIEIVDGNYAYSITSQNGEACDKNVDYVCNRYECDCSGVDMATETGSGTCAPQCGDITFSFESGELASYESIYCAYTAYGEFCYTQLADSYQCPTLAGEPCTCAPMVCGPDQSPLTQHQFSFECSNGFKSDTCSLEFFVTRLFCPDEAANECDSPDAESGCDCGLLDRDSMGMISLPLNGQIACTEPASQNKTCGYSEKYTFNGDKTFIRERCRENSANAFGEVCFTLPYKIDGSCPITADGSPCSDCSLTTCTEYYGFPGFASRCVSSDGQTQYTSYTCGCGGEVTAVTAAPAAAPTTSPNSSSSTTSVAIGACVSLVGGFVLSSL